MIVPHDAYSSEREVVWTKWSDEGTAWDASMRELSGASVFQSWRWGQYRCQFGWNSINLVARKDGRIVAMLQAQTRRYFHFFGVAWSPGGPVGDLSVCGADLRRAIRQSTGARFVVSRLNVMRPAGDKETRLLLRNGWSPSNHKLLSGISLTYDPSLEPAECESRLTKNWRHNLKRSLKRPNTAYHWRHPDAADIKSAYDAMHSYKGIDHLSQGISLESIQSLVSLFGDDCVVVRCDDEQGNMLALRGALVMGDLAWDTFAAATPEGRKSYASYRAFWELMEICRARGVRHYDLGGADPISNKGVYDFKQGTGADVVRFVGEWEHSQPSILGRIVGRRIAARMD